MKFISLKNLENNKKKQSRITKYLSKKFVLYLTIFLLCFLISYIFLQTIIYFQERSHLGKWEATLTKQDMQNQVQKKIYYINENHIIEFFSLKILNSNNTNLILNIEIKYELVLRQKSLAEIVYQIKDIQLQNMEIVKNSDYFQICNPLDVCRDEEEKIKERLIENTKERAKVIINNELKIIFNEWNSIFLIFGNDQPYRLTRVN